MNKWDYRGFKMKWKQFLDTIVNLEKRLKAEGWKSKDFLEAVDWLQKKFKDLEWIVNPVDGYTRCQKHGTKFVHLNEVCTDCWKEAGYEK